MTADELRRAVRAWVARGRVGHEGVRREACAEVRHLLLAADGVSYGRHQRIAVAHDVGAARGGTAAEQRAALAAAGRWCDAQARAARVVVPTASTLSVADVAAWIGVSERWVRRLAAAGELRATRIGARSLSFRRSDVARFIAKRDATVG